MENGPRHTLQIGSDCPGVKGESSGEKIEERVEVVCAAVPNSSLLKNKQPVLFLEAYSQCYRAAPHHKLHCARARKEEKEAGSLSSTGMSLTSRGLSKNKQSSVCMLKLELRLQGAWGELDPCWWTR